MKPSGPQSRKPERLIALVGMTLLLFCPPIIIVIDRLPSANVGWLALYLFGAWAVVISLTAWLMEHRSGH